MFNYENGYSLADIAAATGNGRGNYNGDGFFGGSGWWIILLFLFAWGGWGNNGWGNGSGYGNATTLYGFQKQVPQRSALTKRVSQGTKAPLAQQEMDFMILILVY